MKKQQGIEDIEVLTPEFFINMGKSVKRKAFKTNNKIVALKDGKIMLMGAIPL